MDESLYKTELCEHTYLPVDFILLLSSAERGAKIC